MMELSPPNELGTAFWASPVWLSDERRWKPGKLFLGRHPTDYRVVIGAKIDRHVFLCADTQTGKGRSLFLTNGALYPGSYINITPKPEDADMLAKRRNQRLKQDTYVLDPFKVSSVDSSLRGYWNPIEDMSEKRALRDARRMAHAMTILAKSGESQDWQEKGVELVALLIANIRTNPAYKPEDRHLGTMRRQVLAGKKDDMQEFRELRKQGAIDDHLMPDASWELMLSEIRQSKACNGMLSDLADSFDELRIGHSKGWQSVRKSAQDITLWLDDPDMLAQVSGEGFASDRKLEIDQIKTDPKGVSVFICLPTAEKNTSAAWQRMIMEMMLHRFKELPQPASGHKVLMSVDEFLSYGRVESVLDSMTEIAGAGVALFLGVQNIARLKEIYGESWETFPGSAGLSIWFGLDTLGAEKYLSEYMGEQTICRLTRSANESESNTTTVARGTTKGTSTSQSIGQTEAYGGSNGSTTSISYSTGKQSGSNSGTTYRGGMLFDFLPNTSDGRSSGNSSGKQRSKSEQINQNWQTSKNLVSSQQTNESTTLTYSDGKTVQLGRGWSEQFYKRPLVTVDELRVHFGKILDPRDPNHPGLAIVIEAGTPPYIVRKSYIDQDRLFVGKFTPHEAHPFVPVNKQPMLEYMYTPEHHYGLQMPLDFQARGYRLAPAHGVGLGVRVKTGEPLLQVMGPSYANAKQPSGSIATIRAPCPMTIVHQDEDQERALSVVVRKLGRAPLPAKPCKRLNRSIVAKAKSHRTGLIRKQRREAKESHERAIREAKARERARRAAQWQGVKDFFGKVFWVCFGLGAFITWVTNG